jgi:hypothetical protein
MCGWISVRPTNTYVFGVWVDCWLSQVFSTVEHLTLGHELHSQSSEEHNDVGQVECRNLLRSFSNVKTILVKDGLVEELSHCLRLENGEVPLELLPELQELTYFSSRDAGDAFISFIDARQNAGSPVTLVRHSPSPGPGPNSLSFVSLTIGAMKMGMTSKLEPLLPHANHRVVHLFLGLLSSFRAVIHPIHDRDLSTKDFATPSIPPIYGKLVDIYTSRAHVLIPPLHDSPW